MNRTLLLILAAVALILGSFIWFVATWDPTKEEPVTRHSPKALMPRVPV